MWGNLITLSLLYVVSCVLQLTAAQCDSGAPLTLTEQDSNEFTTPNFPDGSYPRNARCSWLIQVTSGTIELQFPDFYLPLNEFVWGDAPCATTKVEVHDGPTASSPLLGTYCTNTPPPAVTSSSGISMLVFFTGWSFPVRGQGFRATFTVTGGDAVTTASPLPDSTTAVHMTTSPLITTIPPTTSTSSTAASTTRGQSDQTSPADLSSTTMSEAPTTSVPKTTAFTTTKLTTTTPEPTTDSSTTIGITQQADTTTTRPTHPPNTTLQQDTTTPPPTNSSPQDTTALYTTTTQRTNSSPQDTTNDILQSSPSQTTFAASPIGAVTTTKTTSDKFETGQPFNASTIFASTVDSVTETTRPITKSTRHPDMKPTVTTGTPGINDEQSGDLGLTEDQIFMYAAIGGALAGLLFVGMVAAVYFCRGQRQGRFEKSYAIGFQELETLDGRGFGHAINNPVYDRSDADGTGRYNPAHLEASRPDSAYQSLQGSLQGSWASSIDSQQDVEMDVKL